MIPCNGDRSSWSAMPLGYRVVSGVSPSFFETTLARRVMEETSGILVDFMILLVYMSKAKKLLFKWNVSIFVTQQDPGARSSYLDHYTLPKTYSTSQKASIDIKQNHLPQYFGFDVFWCHLTFGIFWVLGNHYMSETWKIDSSQNCLGILPWICLWHRRDRFWKRLSNGQCANDLALQASGDGQGEYLPSRKLT